MGRQDVGLLPLHRFLPCQQSEVFRESVEGRRDMICSICGMPNLREQSIVESFQYEGKTININDFVMSVCEGCNEILERLGKTLREACYEL